MPRPGPKPHATEPREGFTGVGLVVRPHGIRGEVRVHAFAPGAPNLQPGRSVLMSNAWFDILDVRQTKGAWLVAFDGVETREEAETLRGELIELPDDQIERDAPDSYFLYELIGLRVETEDGTNLGTLTEVLQPGANDVYAVRGPLGEILIPAIGEVILSIDLASGLIRVRPLPGLLPS